MFTYIEKEGDRAGDFTNIIKFYLFKKKRYEINVSKY